MRYRDVPPEKFDELLGFEDARVAALKELLEIGEIVRDDVEGRGALALRCALEDRSANPPVDRAFLAKQIPDSGEHGELVEIQHPRREEARIRFVRLENEKQGQREHPEKLRTCFRVPI